MSRSERPVRGLWILLVFALLVCAAPAFARASDPRLDALADELARAIRQNLSPPPSHHHEVTFLVFDFAAPNGELSQFGLQLPDQLSDALGGRISGLKPMKRSALRDLIEKERLDPAAFQSNAAAHWAAKTLEANLAIVGSLQAGDGGIELHLRVIGRDPKKRVAEASAHLDWTADRRTLQSRTVPPFAPASPWKDVPVARFDAVSKPNCIDCPQPGYSDMARLARVEGRAVAQVLVGKDGRVQDVVLLRGLPCGLSHRVVTILKLWRFEPLPGKNGEPAVVQFPVEVNFRLM